MDRSDIFDFNNDTGCGNLDNIHLIGCFTGQVVCLLEVQWFARFQFFRGEVGTDVITLQDDGVGIDHQDSPTLAGHGPIAQTFQC